MAQYIKQGNIFGRIGSGIGEGLASQIPKEIERNRLASGLRNFEQEHQDLSPMQQMARLSAIPGITPQMIQAFGDLARQEKKGQALIQSQNQQNQAQRHQPFPITSQEKPSASPTIESPSLTKGKDLEAVQRGYIRPTFQQKEQIAAQLYNQNPARWGGDPQKAIDAAEEMIATDERRQEQIDKQYEKVQKIQDNIVSRLKKHSEGLNVKVPERVYSILEDKAINATKPISEGGEGLSEQQAMRKYGKELENISRDYQDISSIGGVAIAGRPAKNTLNTLEALRNRFKERGDTENMADVMIAENNISPPMAYAIAQPIKENRGLNGVFRKAPVLEPMHHTGKHFVDNDKARQATEDLIPQIAVHWQKELDSPLAIIYELQKRNYDPQPFIDYLNENADDMLSLPQARQLTKPINAVNPLNDWWLSSWTGVE